MRSRSVLGVLGGVLLALTACGGFGPGGASSGSTQQDQGQTLTYLYFTDGPDLQATKDVVADFEKKTGATVDLQVIPFANLFPQLQARLAAGNAPDVARVTNFAGMQDDLLDLSKFDSTLAGQYIDALVANTKGKHGELLAIPSDLTMNGPLINLDLFQKAGVAAPDPSKKWTWTEMVQAATAVQKAAHTEYAIAMDVSGHRFGTMLSQYGTDYFSADGKSVALDSTKATAAVQEFLTLNQSGAMPKDLWLQAGSKYKAANEIFLAQQVPVYLSGNWQVAAFAQSANFKWEAMSNPCDVRCGGYPGGKLMVAFKQSPHQKLAEEFVAFVNSHDEQAKLDAESNFLPTRKDLVKSGITYPNRGTDMDTFLKDISLTPADTYSSGGSPAFPATAAAMVKELAKALSGQENASQVVSNVKAAAQAALTSAS